MGHSKVSLVVILLWGCLELQSINGYSMSGLEDDPNNSCSQLPPPGQTLELYREIFSDGRNRIVCLDPNVDVTDSRPMKGYTKIAMACTMTPCFAPSVENLCPVRHINGTKHPYDEISREPCNKKDDEPQEYTALCCRENSEDGQLASTAGAESHEFPHIAKLIMSNSHCGSTIYNNRFLVTAAHCIVDHDTKMPKSIDGWYAIIGSNSGDIDVDRYKYKIVNATPHEMYSKMYPNNNTLGDYYLNDIAVLELERDIDFKELGVKSLEISAEGFEPRDYADNAVIVGWGTTNLLDLSLNLQKFNFALRDGNDCFMENPKSPIQIWRSRYRKYKEQLLCVGGYLNGEHGSTAGTGDSGGPAVCRDSDGRAVLCGVTSFGGQDDECANDPNEETCPPSVYARVSFFRDWVRKHAGQQDRSTFYKPYLYGEPVSTRGKYKHQVHITSSGKPCGGTLVAPDVVVTAASCVAQGNGDLRPGVQVHYGVEDVTDDSGVQTFGVTKTELMDGYHVSGNQVDENVQGTQAIMSDNTYKNNLARLKLDGNAPVDPSQLPGIPTEGQLFTEAKELAFPRNTTHGGKLLLRDYRILTKKYCQKRMDRLERRQGSQGGGAATQIDENNLCGVENYSGGSICDRELGGGLICKGNNGEDLLCGVQSFRLCRWSFPNIFVDMSGKPGKFARENM